MKSTTSLKFLKFLGTAVGFCIANATLIQCSSPAAVGGGTSSQGGSVASAGGATIATVTLSTGAGGSTGMGGSSGAGGVIAPSADANCGTQTSNASQQPADILLVLDRSGSMKNNGGSTALPPAVTTFVTYFDNTNDEVAMVSYASNAVVNVAINYNFKTPITNAANAMSFSGGTFGPGGLTLAKAQNDSVAVQPGQNVVKVVVYFTDGYVNEIQDTFNCPAAKLINYGGYDSGTSVDFFDPANGIVTKIEQAGNFPTASS